MVDLHALQKQVYANKVEKGFNVTDVFKEFCYTYGELAEACDAYIKNRGNENVGEELADVVIYLLGISEILGIDLEKAILQKITKNENRKYINENGVLVKVNN